MMYKIKIIIKIKFFKAKVFFNSETYSIIKLAVNSEIKIQVLRFNKHIEPLKKHNEIFP